MRVSTFISKMDVRNIEIFRGPSCLKWRVGIFSRHLLGFAVTSCTTSRESKEWRVEVINRLTTEADCNSGKDPRAGAEKRASSSWLIIELYDGHWITSYQEHPICIENLMNVSKSKTSSPSPPEKGSFPLDHFSECKLEMSDYMNCLKQNSFLARACVSLQKDYFKCRMDRYE